MHIIAIVFKMLNTQLKTHHCKLIQRKHLSACPLNFRFQNNKV